MTISIRMAAALLCFEHVGHEPRKTWWRRWLITPGPMAVERGKESPDALVEGVRSGWTKGAGRGGAGCRSKDCGAAGAVRSHLMSR